MQSLPHSLTRHELRRLHLPFLQDRSAAYRFCSRISVRCGPVNPTTWAIGRSAMQGAKQSPGKAKIASLLQRLLRNKMPGLMSYPLDSSFRWNDAASTSVIPGTRAPASATRNLGVLVSPSTLSAHALGNSQ